MGGAVLGLLLFGGLLLFLGIDAGAIAAFLLVAALLCIEFAVWVVESFNNWMDDWAFNRRR